MFEVVGWPSIEQTAGLSYTNNVVDMYCHHRTVSQAMESQLFSLDEQLATLERERP